MSTTIDEKVVEMKFDNSNFESNVKTSMSTLEKLKEALNFGDSKNGIEELSDSVNNVNFSSLESGIDSLQQRFSAFGIASMTVISELTSTILDKLSSAITSVTDQIVSGGITRAMNLENAEFTLEGILADEERVAEVMNNVNDAVSGTAYSLDAAAVVASSLVASGIEEGEQLTGYLKAIAGVAAVTNSTYDDIGSIFTTIAGNNQLYTVQLQQLASRGLNAAATLADQFGTTETAVREMVSNGEIDFETFANAMESAFGDQASKANETFTGVISNINSALSRIGAEFVSPLIERNGEIVDFLNTVREKVVELKTITDKYAETFTNFVINAANGLNTLLSGINFETLTTSMTANDYAWSSIQSKIEDTGISIEDFQEALITVAGTYDDSASSLITDTDSLMEAISDGWLTTERFCEAIDLLTGNYQTADEAVTTVTSSLEDYKDVVTAVVQGNYGNGEDRITALTEAGYDYATVQELVNQCWKDGVLDLSSLDDATIELTESTAELSDSELESLGYTEDQIEALKALREEVGSADSDIVSIIETLNSMSEMTNFQLAIESIKNVLFTISAIFSSIRSGLENAFSNDTTNLLRNMLSLLYLITDTIKNFFTSNSNIDKMARSFQGFFSIIKLLGNFISSVFRVAIDVLNELLGDFGFNILDVTASAGDAVSSFVDWVIENDYLYKALSKVCEALINVIKTAKSWIENSELIQNGIETLKKKFEEFKDIGINAIKGLLGGLDDGLGGLIDFVKNIGTKIIEAIKEVLQINSPSEATYEIGTNVTQGLYNGIANGLSSLSTLIGNIGSKILGWLENTLTKVFTSISEFVTELGLDFGTLFAGIISVSIIVLLKKLINFLNTSFVSPLNKLSQAITKIASGIYKVCEAYSFELRTEGIKNIAISLLILVGALYLLTQIDTTNLNSAMLTLLELAGILVLMSVAITLLSKSTSTFSLSIKKGFSKTSSGNGITAIVALVASLLIMAAALKLISTIDAESLTRSMQSLAILFLGILTFLVVYGVVSKYCLTVDSVSIASTLLALSVSIAILAGVAYLLSNVNFDQFLNGVVALGAIVVLLLAMVATLGYINAMCGDIVKAGATMLALSVSIAILAGVAVLLQNINIDQFMNGVVGIMGVAVVIIAMVAALAVINKMSGDIAKIGATMLALSVSIAILAGVAYLLSYVDTESFYKGVTCVAILGLVVAGLAAVVGLCGGTSGSLGMAATLLAMSVGIGILAAIAIVLGMVDVDKLDNGIIAVEKLVIVMAALMACSKLVTSNYKSIIALEAAIVVLTVCVVALSTLDPESLDAPTQCLTTLMAVFSLMMAASALVTSAYASLIIMAVVIAELGAIIYILADIPADRAISAAASLSILLLSFSVSLGIISLCKSISYTALISLVAMTAVVAALAVIIGMMASLTDTEKVLTIAESLSLMILSLSAAMVLLEVAGLAAGAALVGIGTLVVGVAAIGTLLAAIGALVTEFPCIEDFINTGFDLLNTLGEGLSNFFQTIVGGFADGIREFAEAANLIDASTVAGIGYLVEAILALTVASLIDQITSFLPGSDSLITFCEEKLPAIAEAVVDFSDTVKDIDDDSVVAAATAGKLLAELINALPSEGGLLSVFTGKSGDMGTFADNIELFGEGILSFSESVADVKLEDVQNGVDAGQLIIDMAESIPNEGGFISKIVGENDMGTFAEDMPLFGQGIMDFATNVEGLVLEDVQNGVDAGQLIIDMADSIPNEGGFVAQILGDNDMGAFAEDMPDFGDGIAGFAEAVSGIELSDVRTGVNAGRLIINLADDIPNEGGFISKLFGDNDMQTFSNQLSLFGSAIADFATQITGIDSESMSNSTLSISNSISTMLTTVTDKISNSSSTFKSSGESLMTSFKNGITSQTDSIKSSFTTVIESCSTAVKNKYGTFTTLGEMLVSKIISGVKSNSESAKSAFVTIITNSLTAIKNKYSEFTSVGETTMTKFIAGVKTKSDASKTAYVNIIANCLTAIKNKYSEFTSVGETTMTKFIAGVKTKDSAASTACKNIAASCVSALEGYYSKFYDAGAYLVEGFADGIDDNTYLAEAKARAMAKAAAEAAEDELDEASPSKVGYGIGDYFGIGFVNGIVENVSTAYEAGSGIAASAKSGLSEAIASVVDIINNDVDAEPTIRPVLDLSDVESKTRTLNAMLSSAQASTISASLQEAADAKIQNGTSNGSNSTQFNFTQNNYSPKSLSRTEIYRQTKNQFSALERKVAI